MSFICRGKLAIVLKDVTKKSVSRGKKQTNEKKQTQVSSKKTNIKKSATKSKKKTVIPKKGAGKGEPKEPKKVKVKTVNMETAPGSSTETDIHHDSNDFSTKESKGTVSMETASESSTETDIHHHSNDLSTKESEGTVNMETAPELLCCSNVVQVPLSLNPFQLNLEFGTTHRVALCVVHPRYTKSN